MWCSMVRAGIGKRLLLWVLSAGAHIIAELPVSIHNDTEFYQALVDPSVSEILVTKDVTLYQEHWVGGLPMLTRNVTIKGLNSTAGLLTTLNMNYVQQLVTIGPGVSVTFDNIVFMNPRYGGGTPLDMFGYSPQSIVYSINATKRHSVCLPFDPVTFQPPVRPPLTGNVPQLYDVIPRWCYSDMCWENVFHMTDYGTGSSSLELGDLAGYVWRAYSTFRVCDMYVNESCIQALGDECASYWIETLGVHQHPFEPPPEPALPAEGSNNNLALKVALPVCLGVGLVVVLAATVALVRRKRAHEQAADLSAKGAPPNMQRGSTPTTIPFDVESGTTKPGNMGSVGSLGAGSGNKGSCSDTGGFPVDIPPRTTLFGSDGSQLVIELSEMLGQGSFGTVYSGTWNNQRAAIKVVQHNRFSSKKVLNEVGIMKQFQHPNVVQALGVLQKDNPGVLPVPAEKLEHLLFTPPEASSSQNHEQQRRAARDLETYIVLEFCDAGNLANVVYSKGFFKRGKLQLHPVLLRLLDVARGMEYLHSRKVCHGDLKCSNVLLSSNSEDPFGHIAKVSDFGLSRVLNEGQTHWSTNTVGTVTHMPPELLRNGKLGTFADVYAFAMLMWECATGVQPYEGLMYGEVVERVLVSKMRPVFPSSVPSCYTELAVRCWASEALDRPHFSEVIAKLENMLQQVNELQSQIDTYAPTAADHGLYQKLDGKDGMARNSNHGHFQAANRC